MTPISNSGAIVFLRPQTRCMAGTCFWQFRRHRRCRCLYDELEECIRSHKDNAEVLEKHRIFLEEEGYPRQMGLTENNVIYRKHRDPRCIKVMEDWWYMVENYSRRDQLSLFYVLWKNGEQMTYLLDFPIKSDKANFRLFHHN